jgi:hypothetical protein
VPHAPATQTPGWGTVRAALALVGVGWILYQASFLILRLLAESKPGRGGGEGLAVVAVVLGVAVLFGLVQLITGMLMCCATPSESGARGWSVGILLALIVCGLMFITILAAGLVRGLITNPTALKVLLYLMIGTMYLAKIFLTCFVWGVARHLRQGPLAVAILVYLPVEVLAMALRLIFLERTEAAMRGEGSPALVFSGAAAWVPLLVGTVLCIWFCIMLFLVRGKVTEAMTGRFS